MKIFFKKVLNGLEVDKYQVAGVLKISTNTALDLIMYEDGYRKLNVSDIRAIKEAFKINTDELIQDERPGKMAWKDVKKLLDAKAEQVKDTLKKWDWGSLKISTVNECPLPLVDQVCTELNINMRALVFG